MTAKATARRITERGAAPNLIADIAELCRNLARTVFDPYRPELHYMRGPGPKWHAKHDRVELVLAAMPVQAPALARVRVRR
jgi:hypothetical protein